MLFCVPHAQLDLTHVREFLCETALQSRNYANGLQAGLLALQAQALAMLH